MISQTIDFSLHARIVTSKRVSNTTRTIQVIVLVGGKTPLHKQGKQVQVQMYVRTYINVKTRLCLAWGGGGGLGLKNG